MARNDTNVGDDTQLAILASLLEPASYPVLELSEALRDNKGDVAAAAEALLLPRVKSSGKRKAGTSLESWLGKKRGSEAVKQQVEVDLTESSPSRRSLPATTSSTPPKPLKNAFTLLTSTSTSSASPAPKSKAPARPAIPLATQSAIDAHSLPLTLLKSPLSPALASALFLALMQESEEWERHRWFLAGRWVESPHTSANFYRRRGGYGQSGMREDGLHMEDEEEHLAPRVEEEKGIALESEKKRAGSSSVAPPDAKTGGSKVAEGRYYYSGSELFPPKPYPNLLHRAAELIEPVVNASLRAHSRHPLEYAGEWRANVCGANRYDGAAIGVGWHADQLTCMSGPSRLDSPFPRAYLVVSPLAAVLMCRSGASGYDLQLVTRHDPRVPRPPNRSRINFRTVHKRRDHEADTDIRAHPGAQQLGTDGCRLSRTVQTHVSPFNPARTIRAYIVVYRHKRRLISSDRLTTWTWNLSRCMRRNRIPLESTLRSDSTGGTFIRVLGIAGGVR